MRRNAGRLARMKDALKSQRGNVLVAMMMGTISAIGFAGINSNNNGGAAT